MGRSGRRRRESKSEHDQENPPSFLAWNPKCSSLLLSSDHKSCFKVWDVKVGRCKFSVPPPIVEQTATATATTATTNGSISTTAGATASATLWAPAAAMNFSAAAAATTTTTTTGRCCRRSSDEGWCSRGGGESYRLTQRPVRSNPAAAAAAAEDANEYGDNVFAAATTTTTTTAAAPWASNRHALGLHRGGTESETTAAVSRRSADTLAEDTAAQTCTDDAADANAKCCCGCCSCRW